MVPASRTRESVYIEGYNDVRRLAVARIEGIERSQAVNCWKQCERALNRDTCEKVMVPSCLLIQGAGSA